MSPSTTEEIQRKTERPRVDRETERQRDRETQRDTDRQRQREASYLPGVNAHHETIHNLLRTRHAPHSVQHLHPAVQNTVTCTLSCQRTSLARSRAA
eukprot:2799016-Rhodomonas_salina.1